MPPHHDDVPGLIDDLVAFSARGDVQVLVHAALAHAPFETIHPFADGNGRTGRALVNALLRRRGLARRVTVPVSAGLLTDVSGYFDALTAYRTGAVDPIVEVLAHGGLAAVVNGRQLAVELRAARARWDDVVVARRDRGRLWQADEVLAALDAFAARAERRSTS